MRKMQLFQTNIFFNLLSVILGTHPWPLSVYINIPSQYDIVSMAKRFHIGFYAECKNVMKCIGAAYVDSRKKHFEPPHDKTSKMTFVPSIRPVCSESSLCAQWVA